MPPKVFPRLSRLRFLPWRYLENKYAGHPLRVSIFCLKLLFFGHVFLTYGYSPAALEGASMLPTFEVIGDWALISRHYRRGRDIKVGDIVSFASVVDPRDSVIKRVIGMQGDYVLRDTPDMNDTMIQIPEGHCWVVGDNLPESRDSRHFGPMPMALIKGKVIAKILPWNERRWIDNGLYSID